MRRLGQNNCAVACGARQPADRSNRLALKKLGGKAALRRKGIGMSGAIQSVTFANYARHRT